MSYVVAPQGSYAYTVSHVNNILWDDTHLCPAHALTPDEAEQFGVRPLTETPKPDFDPATQAVDEIDPAPVAGIWTQQWAIRAATQAEMDAYAAEQAAAAQTAADNAARIEAKADAVIQYLVSHTASANRSEGGCGCDQPCCSQDLHRQAGGCGIGAGAS